MQILNQPKGQLSSVMKSKRSYIKTIQKDKFTSRV